MATRVLLEGGRAVGAMGVNVRTGEFVVIRAKAVRSFAAERRGASDYPASGYLMGTYENPSNAGDGYSMAYHAGAELTNIECFQVNPLIKDYNGPACAYVSGPFGGYTVNAKGNRFHALRLLERPDDAGILQGTDGAERAGVFKNEPSRSRDCDGDRAHPPHHGAAEPGAVPLGTRQQLRRASCRNGGVGDRAVQRSQCFRRVGERTR